MPAIRQKRTESSKPAPRDQTEYDVAIQRLKETLKITPKSAKHLCIPFHMSRAYLDGMGYKSPDALKPDKITPDLLEKEMQEYLEKTNQTFQSAPKRSGAMYRVAFRRILWTARASEQEKKLHPERMTCGYWSNKAIAAREAKCNEE
jgi:hypothetical protein